MILLALLAVLLGAASLAHELRRLHRADRSHARRYARALRRLVVDAPSSRTTCLPPAQPAQHTTAAHR